MQQGRETKICMTPGATQRFGSLTCRAEVTIDEIIRIECINELKDRAGLMTQLVRVLCGEGL